MDNASERTFNKIINHINIGFMVNVISCPLIVARADALGVSLDWLFGRES